MSVQTDMLCLSGFTVGIHLTSCCGTCDLSSLVGMTRHNIYRLYLIVGVSKVAK